MRPNTLSIPLSRMPNVDFLEVAAGMRRMGWMNVAYYYTIKSFRQSVNIRSWINEWIDHDSEALPIIPGRQDDAHAMACLKWVKDNLHYVGDTDVWKLTEYWQQVAESLMTKTGDCFAGYEEIYTQEGIKRIDEIAVGDLVLSYDFKNREYVYKPVIAHWAKGPLQVYRIHFRNGQHLDVSRDHPMWVRVGQKESIYEKTYASNIDLTRWWKRKVPIAVKIPYTPSTPRFEKELYRVVGHFIAEGWVSGKVGSSGYELTEDIIPILERHEIPFSEGRNGSGVPMVNFLRSDFKEYLRGLKTSSFDINLYEELITLPEEYLEELLYGMWLGDGTKNIGKNQANKEWVYSTSSPKLASDIQRIGLHLGRTFHIWKQDRHGGVGKQPIYRITYNPESHFLKSYEYEGLSEVSISHIEPLEEVPMYDLTVEDTHTVVMKNGIVTHQCEDGAIMLYALMRKNGFSDDQLFITAGDVKGGGHCYLVYVSKEDAVHYVLDWCYWPGDSLRVKYGENPNYFYGEKEWFRFNCSGSYIRG